MRSAALLCLSLPSVASGQSLRAGRTESPIRLDGRLTEPAWVLADSIDGLTEVEPVAGRKPASRTVVRVLVTEHDLYIGIVARNPPGVRTTSYSKARDSQIDQEDYLALVFDTFQDGRSGYVFGVNPTGARVDGLVSQRGEDVNPSWDAIWEVKTARSDSGWAAEFRIPIKSLIFRPGLEEWGFNVERMVQATRERSRWVSASPNIEISQTSRAGTLVGLPDFSTGLGLSLRPAIAVGGSKPAPDSSFDGTFHPSLDLTQRVGADLLGHLTVNTDFAETEVDTRRTNLTRFPLFFPEKRSFFLEGADIFEFGLGSGNDVRPFFSRRIGLYEGEEVPLVVGGKINGRAGQTNIGALITVTDEVDGLVPVAGEAALRVQQNVLDESSVGIIATAGDPAGRNSAWTAGADFTYQTSRLGGDKNFLAGIWGVAMGRDSLGGDRTAIGGKFDFPNDLWDVALTWKRIGENFDPSLGFVPRPGVWLSSLGGSFSPRPGKWGIRQMHFELRGNIATDLDFNWESWRVYASPLNWEFESGDRVEIGVAPQGERLVEEFEVADGVVIPPGSYNFTRPRIEFETSSARRLGLGGDYSFGGFYDGTLHQLELGGVWRPSATFNLSFSGEYNVGDLPAGDFTQTLVGTRVQLNLSTALQVSSYWQYDTESRDLGTNSRLRWSFSPQGDVFLVYNHNATDPETGGGLRFKSNDLRIKVQYTFRY